MRSKRTSGKGGTKSSGRKSKNDWMLEKQIARNSIGNGKECAVDSTRATLAALLDPPRLRHPDASHEDVVSAADSDWIE
jgi:hypothetical protein